jgi:hypothetical protein
VSTDLAGFQIRREKCTVQASGLSEGASAVRFTWGFCLVLGLAFLTAAGVYGTLAARQAADVSAYHHASVCLAGAPPDADCLQPVYGAVTAVAEFAGGNRVSADYALDVQTASETLHITFTSDSSMLAYAVDGNPAVVTVWRGIPVSVTTDGRTQATAAVPETAFAKDLGECAQAGGVGVFFVLGAAAIRRNRTVGRQPVTRPVVAAGLLALGLGSLVLLIGGIALGGKPSRLRPDLVVTGGALIVVAGLSVWLGISVSRRVRGHEAALALRPPGLAEDAGIVRPPGRKDARMRMARPVVALRPRLRAATRIPGLVARAAEWVAMLLTVAVLFGVFFTAQDGPPARAFRHAPACVGETNLATCVGEFTATVNGVRAPANGANFADVSYATGDGVINTWARFDGDAGAIARMAEADQNDRTPLVIKVWRRSIVGADLGDTWHWAQGNPPGEAIPTAFLAVSFALLLLVVRMRIHRRARSRPAGDRQQLIIDDLGQTAAAAGAIVLLANGFWAGAILALAALVWVGLSARRSRQARDHALLTSPSSF